MRALFSRLTPGWLTTAMGMAVVIVGMGTVGLLVGGRPVSAEEAPPSLLGEAPANQVAADASWTTSTVPEGSLTIPEEDFDRGSWPRGSGFEPGDPRLFFPTVVVAEGMATLVVFFLDGSSLEMRWPADLDLVSGGVRPEAGAYMMSLQGDYGIFRDLTVERGDVLEMAARMGAPDLVESYADGRGGSVGYWDGEESDGVRYLGYQFGGWALLVPDWSGAGGTNDAERGFWASHIHGEETENGFLHLTLTDPLQFDYDWMTLYFESPAGTVRLELAECSEAFEEAFERTLIWCDESGLIIIRVTGEGDFRERVRDDLDLVAVEPSNEFNERDQS